MADFPEPPAGFKLDQPPPPPGYRIDQPAPRLSANELALGGADNDEYFGSGSVGQLLDWFGQGAKQAWGTKPLGLSPEDDKFLTQHAPDYGLIGRAFHDEIVRPAAVALDATVRAGRAAMTLPYVAAQQLTEQGHGLEAIGGPLLAGMEAFPLGHVTGFPANVPLARAADLGVIGKGEAGFQDLPTAAAVEALKPTGRSGATERVVQPPAPEAGAPPEMPATPAEAGPAPEAPAAPDIHAVARDIAPDTFAEYDALSARKDTFRRWIDELGAQRVDSEPAQALQARIDDILGKVGGNEDRLTKAAAGRLEAARSQLDDLLRTDTPDIARVRADLQKTDFAMRDLAPEVSAAYRKAGEQFPAEEAPPSEPITGVTEPPAPETATEPVQAPEAAPAPEIAPAPEAATPAAAEAPAPAPTAEATPATPVEAPKPAPTLEGGVAADVTKQLVAAGRPAEEAQAAGQLIAAHYEVWADQFPALGSAEDIYRSEAPNVRAGRGVQSAAMEFAQKGELGQAAPKTAAFRTWFADSKVTDDAGEPKVVYHGTPGGDFDQFDIDRAGSNLDSGFMGRGAYLTDRADVADYYASTGSREAPAVIPAYLSMQNPFHWGAKTQGVRGLVMRGERLPSAIHDAVIERTGFKFDPQAEPDFAAEAPLSEAVRRVLLEKGYDGVIADVRGGHEYVAFKPEQIKSAIGNRGTFEAGNPKILEQTRRGKIRLATDDAKATITLFKDADASTFIHETGHQWLEELTRFAAREDAPDQLRGDAATVRQWLGVEDGKEIPTRAHEKFARGFERYMMEGHAPSSKLAAVFGKFRDWLTRIYQTVANLRSPINDDIRSVFDRMVASKEEGEPVVAPERPEAAREPTARKDGAGVIADALGINPRDYSREEFFDMAAEHLSREAQAREIGAMDAEFEKAFSEAEERTKAHIESRGDAWEPDALYDKNEPRTLEDLENAYKSETEAAGGQGERSGGAVEPGPAASGQGPLQEGVRERRRGAGDAGRPGAGAGEAPDGPNRQFGPGDELIDKAGNIRLDNLSQPEDIDAVLREAAERNSGFIAERRGVISDGQMLDLADAVGKDPAFLDAKKIGQAFSGEEILAARKLLIDSATAVRDAMAKAANGGDAELATLAKIIARHEMIQGKVSQATAEWGRAGRAFRNLDGWEGARDLNQFLKQNGGRDLNQLRQMAQLGKSLQTPGQVSKLVTDTAGGKVRQAIIYYWVNTLISGPITHLTYSVGNAINALWTPLVETPLAATSGAVRERLGIAASDRVHFNEVSAQLYGLGKGFRDALPAAVEAYKSGVSPPLPGERISAQFATPAPPPIPGVVGRVIGQPGKLVAGIHSFFKTIRYEQNIQALAARDALNRGLEGNARDLEVARLTANPTDAMMESAVGDALKELYMRPQPYNSPGAYLARATNSFLPAKIIAPFVKIGSEIVRNAFVERTPLGLGSGEVRGNLMLREGGATFDAQLGKVMAGTGLMAAVMIGVLEGAVTGDGPSDPNERRVWLLTHKPNSITVGPLQFSYARLGHLGMLTRFSANMTETAQRWNDEDGPHLARAFFDGITRSVLDETWMRGVKDFFDAIYHPEENFDRWVTGFVAQWTPFSIGLGQVARQIDPYQRETRDLTTAQEIFNQIKAHTPLLSQTLQPRRDIFGEPIANGSGTVDRYANDKVAQAMDALHIGIAPPLRKIRGVQLTPQQYDDYSRTGGRLAKMELDAIVGPGFKTLPPETQIKLLKETVSHARESAAAQVMMQSVGTSNDIIAKAIDSKSAALHGAQPVAVKEKLKTH